MAEGFKSRTFRLTFDYSSVTDSYNSYICLPVDFWEASTKQFEQLGLSFVPVTDCFCWSLAPSHKLSTMEEEKDGKRSIVIESIEQDSTGSSSDYIPFVVGTSVVASGVIKLGLLTSTNTNNNSSSSKKNGVRLCKPRDQEPGALSVLYDFGGSGNVVLVPSIPSILTPADFLAFIREAVGIVDIRLVREVSPGKYMALIRFTGHRSACKFADQFAGKPFSVLEPTLCQVLNVSEIEFSTKVASIVPLFDFEDFKDGLKQCIKEVNEGAFEENEARELPTCPVCLDRLDPTVTGIITTICSHTYHCECMQKWYDGSCPVCRFLLSEEDNGEDGNLCQECGCKENLWLCLICGNLGCGRYKCKHAQKHFEITGHTFSLELETHRVWDYVGDNYVHRLIQNNDDGKLVELCTPGSPSPSVDYDADQDGDKQKKSGPDGDYISSLLVAQLESQRVYYEEKLNALEASLSSQAKEQQTESEDFIDALQRSIKSLNLQRDQLIDQLQSQLANLTERVEALKREKQDLLKSLQSESSMLERLLENQKILEATLQAKEEEIAGLQEQIQDLLMHIEGQKVISQSELADDLKIGSIKLVDGSTNAIKRTERKPSSRKKRY